MWPDLLVPFPLWEQGKDKSCSVCTRDNGNQVDMGLWNQVAVGLPSWEGAEG